MYQSKKELDRNSQNIDQIRKLIRIRSVVELTGLSKSYVYQLVALGQFPKSIQLVPGGSSVAWVATEIQDWIKSRIDARDGEK
jgi:prophage regulatory protein